MAQRAAELHCPPIEWWHWWQLNEERFLRVKETVAAPESGPAGRWQAQARLSRAFEAQVRDEVLPVLRGVLDGSTDAHLTADCLLAIADADRGRRLVRTFDVFVPHLRAEDGFVRQCAALAIGVAGDDSDAAVELLTGLARDDALGRTASAGPVDPRTRAFATYALGLVGRSSSRPVVVERVVTLGDELLRNDAPRDVQVAAIHAIAAAVGEAPERATARDHALRLLEKVWLRPVRSDRGLVQAHCPAGIARLCGRDDALARRYRDMFGAALREKGTGQASELVTQSCSLALGELVRPGDREALAALQMASLGHGDAQTRWFALLALGQIGGPTCRALLLDRLVGSREVERGWCALALGVLCRGAEERQPVESSPRSPDAEVGAALFATFRVTRDPSDLGAIAIALGLARCDDAAHAMLDLASSSTNENLSALVCTGLALMDHREARDDIRTLLERSQREYVLLQAAAVSLGTLGDPGIAAKLFAMASSAPTNPARCASLWMALAQVGDRETVAHALQIVEEASRSPLDRSLAAAALGRLCNGDPLPWTAHIAENLNHRARVPTLGNGSTGFLDLR